MQLNGAATSTSLTRSQESQTCHKARDICMCLLWYWYAGIPHSLWVRPRETQWVSVLSFAVSSVFLVV